MTSPRDELREKIDKMISLMCHSDDQGCEVCTRGTDAILTAVDVYHKSEMARVIGGNEYVIDEAIRVTLTDDNWDKFARNKLRAEQRKRAGLDH